LSRSGRYRFSNENSGDGLSDLPQAGEASVETRAIGVRWRALLACFDFWEEYAGWRIADQGTRAIDLFYFCSYMPRLPCGAFSQSKFTLHVLPHIQYP
jgi:hypothetical protein